MVLIHSTNSSTPGDVCHSASGTACHGELEPLSGGLLG